MRVLARAALACLAAGLSVAQAAGPILSSAGNWDLRPVGDGPAEAGECVLTPKTQSRIRIGRDRLTVTALPRNSIFNYQYRIDENSASAPAMPSSAMQDAGVIDLDGKAFDEILKGRRFQIRILDKWHEAITEDVDLSGAGDLHRKMGDLCASKPAGADGK